MQFSTSKFVAAGMLVGVALCAGKAQASLSVTSLGNLSPVGQPATAGMIAFGLDPQPFIANVTSVAAPTGGVVDFNSTVSHRRIGTGWASWSHGYTGDVYYTTATSVTLTLPAGAVGFYLYVEPDTNPAPTGYTVTATNSLGEVQALSQDIAWQADARGWAISSSSQITSIVITDLAPGTTGGFAIGEFGIAVPAPGAMALLGLAGLVGSRRRRA